MHTVTVKPLQERIEIIANQVAASTKVYEEHDLYDGKVAELRMVMLPIDVPLYRMANGRTATAQLAYIREHGVDGEFFSEGEDDQESQQAQHEILKTFADQKSDSVQSISAVLQRDGQQQPLLISPNGVVVNGNRRLAAMRELHDSAGAGKSQFGHVLCAVLPPLTKREVLDFEMKLQMAPNTKLPYHWIDECLVVENQLKLGSTEQQVATLLRKKKPDVKKLRGALAAVRAYLTEWKKEPDNYGLVDKSQQFFGDLYEQTKSKKGVELEASRMIAWLILDERQKETVRGRLYDHKKLMGPNAGRVAAALNKRFELSEPTVSSDEPAFEFEAAGGPQQPNDFAALLTAGSDPELRAEMSAVIIEIGKNLDEEAKISQKGVVALRTIESINTRISEVDLTDADAETFGPIISQLDAIMRRAKLLRQAADQKSRT